MNVFAKNTTASAITVASWTVSYIDSTDAEIVEVQKTSGQALPSVGDTVTFGNYPQATSTPEPIEWTVLAVDSVNGKVLLIAKKVLDCQNFNSGNTNTTWETCSLRTWLNSTFFNAAFDSTEQGRISTTHVETPNNPSYPSISGGNATNDKVFLLSIQEANNTSYFENADARKTLATQTAISNGIYEESGYAYWMLRSLGSDQKSVADVLPNGGLSYSGLSTYSAPGNGIRPAIWLGFSLTIRRNAFKYSLSGTPYWYVIDGGHDTWTDDLSAWGYSEVPVGPVLPDVILDNWVLPDTSSGTTTIQGGSTAGAGKAGAYPREKVAFDNSCAYATTFWRHADNSFAGRVEIAPVNNSGYIGLHNTTNQALEVYWVNYAICSDSTATVVTVYDSSNNAYNAFKFTTNNTDYYYVLDGTQTDWTDDLGGIGYSLYLTGWANASHTDVSLVRNGGVCNLKDGNGNNIPYNDNVTYTGTRIIDSNGNSTAFNYYSGSVYLRKYSNALSIYNDTSKYLTVQRVEYTVS